MVEIIAARDATIYNDPTTTPLANGAGQYFFAGRVGENDNFAVRRALLYFDVAANVPAGMIITSASLRIYVNQRPLTARATDPFFLYAASQDWNEGASDPSGPEGSGTAAAVGDVTWYHTSYTGATWTSEGGDFAATASASQDIGNPGPYEFASLQMISESQAWLDGPGGNFGWFLLGDEETDQSPRRFYSRESGDDTAPTLILGYDVVPEPRGLFVFGLLLLKISNDWKKRRRVVAAP